MGKLATNQQTKGSRATRVFCAFDELTKIGVTRAKANNTIFYSNELTRKSLTNSNLNAAATTTTTDHFNCSNWHLWPPPPPPPPSIGIVQLSMIDAWIWRCQRASIALQVLNSKTKTAAAATTASTLELVLV